MSNLPPKPGVLWFIFPPLAWMMSRARKRAVEQNRHEETVAAIRGETPVKRTFADNFVPKKSEKLSRWVERSNARYRAKHPDRFPPKDDDVTDWM